MPIGSIPSCQYRADVLDELATHGIRPREHTSPAVVRALLNDLYTFELRRLRAALLRREFPRTEYAGRVTAIRLRYPLLSLPVTDWLEPTAAETGRRPPSRQGSPCS